MLLELYSRILSKKSLCTGSRSLARLKATADIPMFLRRVPESAECSNLDSWNKRFSAILPNTEKRVVIVKQLQLRRENPIAHAFRLIKPFHLKSSTHTNREQKVVFSHTNVTVINSAEVKYMINAVLHF